MKLKNKRTPCGKCPALGLGCGGIMKCALGFSISGKGEHSATPAEPCFAPRTSAEYRACAAYLASLTPLVRHISGKIRDHALIHKVAARLLQPPESFSARDAWIIALERTRTSFRIYPLLPP